MSLTDLQLDDINEDMFLTILEYKIPKTRQFMDNGNTRIETETKPSYAGVPYKVIHLESPFIVVEGWSQNKYSRSLDTREFKLMKLSDTYVKKLEPRFFRKKKKVDEFKELDFGDKKDE